MPMSKQEYLLAVEDLTKDESPNYIKGFRDGTKLLSDYIKELTDCQKSQPTKSEDVS